MNMPRLKHERFNGRSVRDFTRPKAGRANDADAVHEFKREMVKQQTLLNPASSAGLLALTFGLPLHEVIEIRQSMGVFW